MGFSSFLLRAVVTAPFIRAEAPSVRAGAAACPPLYRTRARARASPLDDFVSPKVSVWTSVLTQLR